MERRIETVQGAPKRSLLKGSYFETVHWLDVSVVGAVVLVCGILILVNAWRPWADQLMLIDCGAISAGYPAISQGLSSCLISALVPKSDPVTMNIVLRMLAMVIYILAAAVLCFQQLKSSMLRCLFFLMLTASFFPFVWLSSELIAGAFMCLACAMIFEGRRPLLTGILLSGLGAAKPDLILVALALSIYALVIAENSKAKRRLLGGLVGMATLMILPGLLLEGPAYFWRGVERGRISFGQHAANLFVGRPVWEQWEFYFAQIFPGATGFWDAITMYPGRYLRYLILSAGRGLFSARAIGSWLFFSVPVLLVWILRKKISLPPFLTVFALTLIGFLPLLFVSYPHIRYMARYYPSFAILFLCLVARLQAVSPSVGKTVSMWLVGCPLALYLIERFYILATVAATASAQRFWGAD